MGAGLAHDLPLYLLLLSSEGDNSPDAGQHLLGHSTSLQESSAHVGPPNQTFSQSNQTKHSGKTLSRPIDGEAFEEATKLNIIGD